MLHKSALLGTACPPRAAQPGTRAMAQPAMPACKPPVLHLLPSLAGRYVPLGLASWFHRRGVRNVVQLDWWQEVQHPGSSVRWGRLRWPAVLQHALAAQHGLGASHASQRARRPLNRAMEACLAGWC